MGLFDFKKSPKPENALEALIIEASQKPEKRPDFYKAVLNYDIFVIGQPEGPMREDGMGGFITSKGARAGLRCYEIEGHVATPIFSSLRRLEEWAKSEVDFIRMKGVDLFKALAQNPKMNAVMNPKSSFGKYFDAAEIKAMLDGSIFELLDRRDRTIELPDDKGLFIGQPAVWPAELIDKVVNYLKTTDDVEKAFLAQIYIENDSHKPHPLIAIQMAKNSRRNFKVIQSEIAPLIKEIVIPGGLTDFFELSQGVDLAASIFKNFKLIYQKEG